MKLYGARHHTNLEKRAFYNGLNYGFDKLVNKSKRSLGKKKSLNSIFTFNSISKCLNSVLTWQQRVDD